MINKISGDEQRALFVGNCSLHSMNHSVDLASQRINTKPCKLLPYATDLVQSANSFVIQKIKEVWCRK